MNLILHPPEYLKGAFIRLPASKSIANRALIIRALCAEHFRIFPLSWASDTRELVHALKKSGRVLQVGEGGTTYRFLTALLSLRPGERTLLAGPQMRQRPVKPLVDALRQLGAEISYIEKEGFPPLRIMGKPLAGGRVDVDPSRGSQAVSALLLIGPSLPKGLEIRFRTSPVSSSYIALTIEVMRFFGAQVKTKGQAIRVVPGSYNARDFIVEKDWSAAGYFFEIAALAGRGNIFLRGLRGDSVQGDRVIARWCEAWGVVTRSRPKGLTILCLGEKPGFFEKDLSSQPDLFPTLAALCAGTGVPGRFTGLAHLAWKESNRLLSMRQELERFGIKATITDSTFFMETVRTLRNPGFVDAHDDHRLAMALAPLTLVCGAFEIRGAGVVEKSFPGYWQELEKLGFRTEVTARGE